MKKFLTGLLVLIFVSTGFSTNLDLTPIPDDSSTPVAVDDYVVNKAEALSLTAVDVVTSKTVKYENSSKRQPEYSGVLSSSTFYRNVAKERQATPESKGDTRRDKYRSLRGQHIVSTLRRNASNTEGRERFKARYIPGEYISLLKYKQSLANYPAASRDRPRS